MKSGVRQIRAADLDGDGDLDVLAASTDNTIAWYENTDGGGSFGPVQTISIAARNANSVAVGDLDGDGANDVVSASSADDTIAWYRNRGGQFSLATRDIAPSYLLDDRASSLLRIDVTHEGMATDPDAELAQLELLFEEVAGDPLTSLEANALIQSVRIYVDDGSGRFEVGTDTLVTTVAPLSLSGGLQIIPFTDGDPNVALAADTSSSFFVVVDLTPDASTANPGSLHVSHPAKATVVEARGANIALDAAAGGSGRAGPVLVLSLTGDEDNDGLSNVDEVDVHGTDPLLADSDGDGLGDEAELVTYGTNPLAVDGDGDGLGDWAELFIHNTSPVLADSDGDGLSDGEEVVIEGTNPLLADSDGDGLSDGDELGVHGTDPLVVDSDGDGLGDGDEVATGTSPALVDTDADGEADSTDNCPSAYNPDQGDSGGFDSVSPDGVGDLCQNGDFNGDGTVDILDIILQRRGLAELEPTLDPSMPPRP